LNLVIDATLTMAWYFEDESTEVTDELLNRVAAHGALVPGHWRLEVASAFQAAIRRKHSDAVYRDSSLAELMHLPITIDPHTNSYAWSATLRLAEKFSLTVYDAAYLELAHRHSIPLGTLDRELRAAAISAGIEILGADDGDTT
jgi:predicted nucleic acid-binding protein